MAARHTSLGVGIIVIFNYRSSSADFSTLRVILTPLCSKPKETTPDISRWSPEAFGMFWRRTQLLVSSDSQTQTPTSSSPLPNKYTGSTLNVHNKLFIFTDHILC